MSYTDVKNKIDILNKQIVAYGKMTSEQIKKINYKFRLEWNYNSNSMEGNTLTVEETRSVMIGNLDVHQKPFKDVAEMKGHDEVISEIIKIGKGELRLSEKRIKDIHSTIMYEEAEVDKEKIGQWKKVDNYILNRKGERYDFLSYEEVPDKIHDLLNRTNTAIDALKTSKKNTKHPLDIAFQFHLEFLAIHPFYDGNGRTARILTNLILIATGYPPFWITEKERDPYYAYLTDIQGYGGIKDLLDEYMANLILRSQQLILNVVEGKDIEEEDDLQKEISILKRQLEGEKFTKSPKSIYDVFQFSKENIWESIAQVVSKFDDFFDDSKTFRFVGYNKEILQKSNLMTIFQATEKPHDVTIFGHNIYETEIHNIKWEHKKYGLKNAKNLNEYTIILMLTFDHYQYKITVSVNGKEVFEQDYFYNEFVGYDVLKGIKKDLGKDILFDIKSDVAPS